MSLKRASLRRPTITVFLLIQLVPDLSKRFMVLTSSGVPDQALEDGLPCSIFLRDNACLSRSRLPAVVPHLLVVQNGELPQRIRRRMRRARQRCRSVGIWPVLKVLGQFASWLSGLTYSSVDIVSWPKLTRTSSSWYTAAYFYFYWQTEVVNTRYPNQCS